MAKAKRGRVGELRPSQIVYSFGVGAVVDLPHISALVMGLDDWPIGYAAPLAEDRLLAAIRRRLGPQVERLLHPPMPQPDWDEDPFSEEARIGVPVGAFPQWMRCPQCDLLAPLSSGLFEPYIHPVQHDRSRFEHINCQRQVGRRKPIAVPARFLAACLRGHLDDFPWRAFVHRANPSCKNGQLSLKKIGPSDEASDLLVVCSCGAKRNMTEAFETQRGPVLGLCRGLHPHLREVEGCDEPMRPILLGASNSWFPVTLSALALPSEAADELTRLVEDNWDSLKAATSIDMVSYARHLGALQGFGAYDDAQIWDAVKAKRAGDAGSADDEDDEEENLKSPEWRVLTSGKTARRSDDFQMREVEPPAGFDEFFEKTVALERLREVRALIAFTRIEPPGELGEDPRPRPEQQVSLARGKPSWVPASEVRGEGILVRLREDRVHDWCADGRVRARAGRLFEGHRLWRLRRGIEDADEGFPGIRTVLLHSLSHALMRQMALSGGYAAASIRERIYSCDPSLPGGPMAGILLYTAAPDSEGTLGGLVALADPMKLGRLLREALEQSRLCASDPLCAEHDPTSDDAGLHGAACHACLFAAETSCEFANRYLDRTLLAEGLGHDWPIFFSLPDTAE